MCLSPPLSRTLQACPISLAERKVLSDGKTKAVPYPKKGFNCNPYGMGLAEKALEPGDKKKLKANCKGVKPFVTDLYKPYSYRSDCLVPPMVPNIQNCPIDERKVLNDGVTIAVPYPKPGFNCNPYGIAA